MASRYDDWHRRPQPVEDEDMGNEEISTLAKSSKGRLNGEETKPDPVYQEYLRPFPETINTIMPFHGAFTFTLSNSGTSTNIVFRLDSVYDVIKSQNNGYVADPSPGTQQPDNQSGGVREQPMMRNWWANLYRYWTVTKSTYKVRYYTTTESTRNPVDIFAYHHGEQFPPNTKVERQYRLMHQGMRHYELNASWPDHGKPYTEQGITITGMWKPGDYFVKHGVEEDENKQIWQTVDPPQVPTQANFLNFIHQKAPFNDQENAAVTVQMHVEIIYHCQWKDLKAKYQYPQNNVTFDSVTNMFGQASTTNP